GNTVDSNIGHAYISTDIHKDILGSQSANFIKQRNKAIKKAKPLSMSFKGEYRIDQKLSFKDVKSNNILGYMRGSDPKLADEVLIITAHMDHLGKRGDYIYHGADDDGSGTTAVLSMARAFTKAAEYGFRPKRSILFMLVTGEEKGLYGSKYYTTFPVLPLENTVADLNIDMIGRIDPKHIQSADSNYIYIIGSDRISMELHELSESVNARFSNLTLDYTYNSPTDPNRFYYRSDHYNFAEKGIPIIFYFSGVHEDYHKPSDTIDKIHFNLLRKRAQLVFYTAWEIANRPERLKIGTN
ncbi:MAG TPA: M28 family peptidase, partial [Saprospiraceae bacterium]|nr:M28 family peptidase [Saprospiraceae bacterium]